MNVKSCTECGRLTSCFCASIIGKPEPICIFCVSACVLLSLGPQEVDLLAKFLMSRAVIERTERAMNLGLFLRRLHRHGSKRSTERNLSRSHRDDGGDSGIRVTCDSLRTRPA